MSEYQFSTARFVDLSAWQRPSVGSWTRRDVVMVLAGSGLGLGAATLARVGGSLSGAPDTPAPPGAEISRRAGAWTSFGSVALLSADRQSRDAAAVGTHVGPGAADASEHAWPDVLQVGLEVHNGLDRYLLFSSGQFRLEVGAERLTVAPFASGGRPRALAPGATLTTWVSFLAPAGVRASALQFADPGLGAPPLRLELPVLDPAPRRAGGVR